MSTYISNRNGGGQTDEQGHYRLQTKMMLGNVFTGLQVKQNSPLARNVLVPAGDIKIDYGEYAYTGWNDADVTVSIATADTTNPRLDRIVAYVDRSLATGGTNNPGYLKFLAVAGTPAGSPTKASDATVQAAVTAAAGAVASPWCEIAVVQVDANATTIANSKITDTRVMITTAKPARDYPGVIKDFAGAAAQIPQYYLACFGQAVSRTTYADLFAAIGTLWGTGDGSTTFNLPDLRGYGTAGADNMGGSAANVLQKSTTISTTSGSPTATVASATGLYNGMKIVSTNVPAGTTISDINGTTVTMSGNASATASGTAARFSIVADANVVGSRGGETGHIMTIGELVSHNHSIGGGQGQWVRGGSGANAASINQGGSAFRVDDNMDTTGRSQASNVVQPTAVVNKIIAY